MAQADRAVEAAKRAAAGFTGRLRVTFLSSVAHNLLPDALHTFRTLYPDIQLTLTEATTGAQIRSLIEDRSDLGILMPPSAATGDLRFEVLKEDGLLVALPKGHALADKQTIELRELATEPWILLSPSRGTGPL
ncbi:LysR family substrate-binding domain-containing protein [Bradyrhizobium sp. RDT10]